MLEQSTQNSIITAYYYHLVILVNVNTRKQVKGSNVFLLTFPNVINFFLV